MHLSLIWFLFIWALGKEELFIKTYFLLHIFWLRSATLSRALIYFCKIFKEHSNYHLKFSRIILTNDKLPIATITLFLVSIFKTYSSVSKTDVFFSIWVFFHEHSRITGLQEKRESISFNYHFHFHPLHRHLDIIQAITAESSPLHIASSRARTRNLWFLSASR